MNDRLIPERKLIKRTLRECGLSKRQADAVLRDGWKALVGESEAELDELKDELKRLTTTIAAKS